MDNLEWNNDFDAKIHSRQDSSISILSKLNMSRLLKVPKAWFLGGQINRLMDFKSHFA